MGPSQGITHTVVNSTFIMHITQVMNILLIRQMEGETSPSLAASRKHTVVNLTFIMQVTLLQASQFYSTHEVQRKVLRIAEKRS